MYNIFKLAFLSKIFFIFLIVFTSIVSADEDKNYNSNDYQLVHTFFSNQFPNNGNSDYYNLLKNNSSFFSLLGVNQFFRIKANLNHRTVFHRTGSKVNSVQCSHKSLRFNVQKFSTTTTTTKSCLNQAEGLLESALTHENNFEMLSRHRLSWF